EFSFSIALSAGLLFLGLLARGLDTGRWPVLASVALAVTGLCHLLPTVFVVVAAVVLLVLRPGRRQVLYVLTVLAIGACLAAFWSVPFGLRLGYANDMGWEKISAFKEQIA